MGSITYGVNCAACQSIAYRTDYSWSGSVIVCYDCGYSMDYDDCIFTFRDLVSKIQSGARNVLSLNQFEKLFA
jgi:hypothetical protein